MASVYSMLGREERIGGGMVGRLSGRMTTCSGLAPLGRDGVPVVDAVCRLPMHDPTGFIPGMRHVWQTWHGDWKESVSVCIGLILSWMHVLQIGLDMTIIVISAGTDPTAYGNMNVGRVGNSRLGCLPGPRAYLRPKAFTGAPGNC
jgi:hypothetical protein